MIRRPLTLSRWIAVSLLALGLAPTARGAETQLWVTNSPADYAKAESRGVVVRPDGVLTLGPRTSSTKADSLPVIWAIAVLKDGSVALAGDGGRVDRWTESGGIRPWAKLPVGQVLALAADGDGAIAGTGPNGVIYRIASNGDTTSAIRTGERYVWGLAPAGRGAWYAATGTRGRLLRIEDGRTRVVLDSDESNLVSVVSDGRGGAYAGGDSKGRILHARADGSIGTVYDAGEDEIKALAIGPDAALYAAALSGSAVSAVSSGSGSSGTAGGSGSGSGSGTGGGGDDDRDSDAPARSAVTGGRATVYRIVPDSIAAPIWASPQSFVLALAGRPGPPGGSTDRILAATGNRAALYSLGTTNHGTQWLAAPEGQITALAVDSRGRVFAASSNPGALWRLGPERAERGELLSSVLDARRFARFGRMRWRGDARGGRVELLSRSGNSDPPDTTWSRWASVGEGGRIVSPPARYLQWKLALAGGEPQIDAVEVAWREQNLPPRVDDLAVAPQGIGFREGELLPRSDPVTQTLPGGQKVEYSISTNSQKALRELPAWARGLRTVTWKSGDPNGDPLRFDVHVRSEGSDAWIELGDDLEAASFTWDTNALPDGRYRVRVTASDLPGNAVGEELTGTVLSEPFTIDNTAPVVASLEVRGESGAAVVSGRAEDAQSMLTRLEVAVDEGSWRTLTPEGGFADERTLSFRARLNDLKPGEHTVAVRAIDLAGNSATRATRVTVPGGR
jgi:hypothetical protein